jgi:hypothetical protein
LSNSEFNDLEEFGKIIEKPEKKDNTREKKKIKISLDLQVIIVIFIKFFYFIKKLLIKIKVLVLNILAYFRIKKEMKKRCRESFTKRNRKNKHHGYKIIETKKQRGNKTVIVRKRVPFYLDNLNLVKKYSTRGIIYYLSLNEETEQDCAQVKHNSYTILKKSVWDFPVKDKSIFRRTSNTLRIRSLFKK